jgi:hypothetical protein
VIRREEALPTAIEEGLDEAKGQRVEILPTDGVVWCVTPEFATQSWTEVGGGWSTMELKELASNCWSQLAPSQVFHPGPGAACWYNGRCCCCGPDRGRETRRGLVWQQWHADAAVHRARCIGPTVGTSGGGGLARRPTTTSAASVVLVVMAVAITAIVVFVAILGSVATGAIVATMGQARRRGRRWLGRRGCNVGVEHRRGSWKPGTVYVKLLQEQIIPNFEEVQKWQVAPNDRAHVLEVLVQPLKNIEDEDPIVNRCTEVSQTIGHGLELAAVLIDREVTLNKSTKSSIKVKSTVLTVT